MKKLLISLPLILTICTVLKELNLPYNSPILHAENFVVLRNNPSCFNYYYIQSGINSGVKTHIICSKTNQCTSSIYKGNSIQYASCYSTRATINQSNWADIPLGVNGTANNGAAAIQSTPEFTIPQKFYYIVGYNPIAMTPGYSDNGDYAL
jgi:hypothetical protein